MKRVGGSIFAVGSLSWALAQWLLIWMFARFAGGADVVGQYALLLSIATPVFTFAQFGLRTVFVSLRVAYAWRTYVHIRLAGLALGVGVGAALFIASSSANVGLWCSIVLLKLADACFDLVQARIQRAGRLAELGLLNLGNSIGTIVFCASTLVLTSSIALAVAASALVSTIVAFCAWLIARRVHEDATAGIGYGPVLRAGLPTTVSEGLASLSSYIPVLVLSRTGADASIGVYAAASYLLTFANLAGAIMKNVVVTTFREALLDAGLEYLRQRVRFTVAKAFVAGLVVALFVVAFGSKVMVLAYGPTFALERLDLVFLAAALLPLVPAYVCSAALNVMHDFGHQAWTWGLTIVLGIATGMVCLWLHVPPLRTALLVAFTIGWVRFLSGALLIRRAGMKGDAHG